MSDNTTNDGKPTPNPDAATPNQPRYREPDAIDYDAAAAAEATNRANSRDLHSEQADPAGFTGTGSHAAVPVAPPATEPHNTTATADIRSDDNAETTARPSQDAEHTQQYTPAAQPPVYVQAPVPPRMRGNRGGGIAIALLATLIYAALYSLVAFIIAGTASTSVADASSKFADFVVRPVFYVPVAFFFVAFAILIALTNRAGWWSYVLFGFLVGAVVYFSYIGGALLTVQAWTLTPEDAARFVSTQWLNPGAIAAGVIAREVPIWAGAWIARRGRGVTARNVEARQEYDRQLAEGPQLSR